MLEPRRSCGRPVESLRLSLRHDRAGPRWGRAAAPDLTPSPNRFRSSAHPVLPRPLPGSAVQDADLSVSPWVKLRGGEPSLNRLLYPPGAEIRSGRVPFCRQIGNNVPLFGTKFPPWERRSAMGTRVPSWNEAKHPHAGLGSRQRIRGREREPSHRARTRIAEAARTVHRTGQRELARTSPDRSS